MFKVKQYDLGDQVERVGFYQDVVDEMQENKNKIFTPGNDRGYKYEPSEEQKRQQNIDRALQRAKTKIRRLTQRYNMRYMWTLTFKYKFTEVKNRNGSVETYDTGDFDSAWHLWKMFLKRCKRAGLDFDYICTIEVQEKRLQKYGEKVYHFHFITNEQIPITWDKARKQGKNYCLADLWGHGYCFVSKKKSEKKLAHLYVIKYVAKLLDEIGTGRQRYRVKQGLEIPVEEFLINNHIDFYLSAGEEVRKSSYLLLGDKLEIFWLIYDKGKP